MINHTCDHRHNNDLIQKQRTRITANLSNQRNVIDSLHKKCAENKTGESKRCAQATLKSLTRWDCAFGLLKSKWQQKWKNVRVGTGFGCQQPLPINHSVVYFYHHIRRCPQTKYFILHRPNDNEDNGEKLEKALDWMGWKAEGQLKWNLHSS